MSSLKMQAASGSKARSPACSGSVSSLRVRPFTALAKPARNIKARVAAPEAQADEDFSFSFSDAKKSNEYQASDVEAALRFYIDGEGVQPSFDADFVTNALGMEDASFFDDIDNNEAYAEDEYVVAGIPEAAPKKRGRGRREGGDAAEEDDLEQAKALDKVKAMEDRMVLEAALEENFGDAADEAQVVDRSTGVWDWLLQTDADASQVAQLQDARVATRKRTTAANVTDADVNAELAVSNNPEVFESAEVRGYLEMFTDDGLPEEALEHIAGPELQGPGPQIPDVEDDGLMAKLDALLEQPLPEVPAEMLVVPRATGLPRLEDEAAVDKAVIEKYIATLRAAASNKAGVSEADVKAMFGDRLQLEVAGPAPGDDAEVAELLGAAEPTLEAVDFDLDALTANIEDDMEEEDDGGLGADLAELAAFGALSADDLPSDEQIAALEAYVSSGEAYLAQEEERKAQIAAAVARGELPADVLAEDLEDVPDAFDEIVAENLADEAEEGDMLDVFDEDEEDDGEQWVERIIELTRVTKVVKGGKIMGFRCVAIVGNQNGLVGVGCQAGREVAVAVKRTLVDAKKNVVRVPLVGAARTLPHRAEAKYHAARCVVVPASDGTGCIAGGSIRSVLELAGVKNCLAKRIGSRSALNSARATVKALQSMQTLPEVAKARGVDMEHLLLPQ